MLTEQWICRCGCHNSFLRLRCRECRRRQPRNKSVESPLQVITNVEAHNEVQLLKSTFGHLEEPKTLD